MSSCTTARPTALGYVPFAPALHASPTRVKNAHTHARTHRSTGCASPEENRASCATRRDRIRLADAATKADRRPPVHLPTSHRRS